MSKSVENALAVLRAHGIEPYESDAEFPDIPGIGEVEEGETVYATSLDDVFWDDPRGPDGDGALETEGEPESPGDIPMEPDEGAALKSEWEWEPPDDDHRLLGWWREVRDIVLGNDQQNGPLFGRRRLRQETYEPPEPHCAWYCPIHFFGHGWGIYIRESCIFDVARDIASFVNWNAVKVARLRPLEIMRQLLRSAFYVFFLHEQFHHKVESLGFRLLVATATDRYRPYKSKVYQQSFLTPTCLEECLANAESYRRLTERRYKKRHAPPMLRAVQDYLAWSIPRQPPGYAQGINYLSEAAYRQGLYSLQSQILDGLPTPSTPPSHWSVAPDVITSLMSIDADIYVILPAGARPIFRASSIDPGATTSTAALTAALTRHYGYTQTRGGKGSHVKLVKPHAPNIHLPGNRPVVSPGMVKQVLEVFGGYPISRLPDLLGGRLPQPHTVSSSS
jgi:hypothetical protein